jgi:hypothetical protein
MNAIYIARLHGIKFSLMFTSGCVTVVVVEEE